MVRFWLGAGLLAAFLGFSLWVGVAIEQTQDPISAQLEQAAAACLQGDPREGYRLAQQAHTTWQTNWHWVAAVSDHAPMDEIDSLFAQMDFYAQAGQTGDFAAYCTRLAQLVLAVAEAHSLHWWNLF